MKFCQDFIHSVLLTVTFVFTCNRVFNSTANSIDSNLEFLNSSFQFQLDQATVGINTRINQKDNTKSIPPGFIYGSSLPSKLQVETNRIPAIIHISRSQKFPDGLNYIKIIKLLFDSF
ncbi:Hypothetical_protein [Hexamita inflata]|uniref:Hypothetical_protein n=1 Tax=Hexamita inflata TaxID=28002 RepID=A0ABP1HWL4_9EUKA